MPPGAPLPRVELRRRRCWSYAPPAVVAAAAEAAPPPPAALLAEDDDGALPPPPVSRLVTWWWMYGLSVVAGVKRVVRVVALAGRYRVREPPRVACPPPPEAAAEAEVEDPRRADVPPADGTVAELLLCVFVEVRPAPVCVAGVGALPFLPWDVVEPHAAVPVCWCARWCDAAAVPRLPAPSGMESSSSALI